MCGLAGTLPVRSLETGDDFAVSERELPHPWGFLWLDDPLVFSVDEARERTDADGQEVVIRAVIWGSSAEAAFLGRGVNWYGFADDPSNPGCPLALSWFGRFTWGEPYESDPPGRFIVMLWRLLDMEITDIQRRGCGDRQLDKQARRSIRHGEINIVRLRRPTRHEPSGEPREVRWSCSWVVRGHLRRYREPVKSGPNAGKTQVWIRPYIKGSDGLPLKASDVLYLLQR